jgi:DNA-binding transcriptional LysR family regulator
VYQRILLLTTGRFVGVLSSSVLRTTSKHFSLKVLPVDLASPSWPVAIVTSKNRTITPVVQAFIDCIRNVATPLSVEESI